VFDRFKKLSSGAGYTQVFPINQQQDTTGSLPSFLNDDD